MDWKTLFLSPEGRIGRQAFWIGWLVVMGASTVLNVIPVVGHVLMLGVIYASVCIHTKRLHDMGQTGWWQVLPWVIGPSLVLGAGVSVAALPAIAAITTGEPVLPALQAVAGLVVSVFVAFGLWLAFTLWVGYSVGDARENKYGPAPIQPVSV